MELRQRLRAKRLKRARRGAPKSLIVVAFAGCVITGFGLTYHEEIDQYVSRFEFSAFGQAQAENAENKKTNETEAKVPAGKDAESLADAAVRGEILAKSDPAKSDETGKAKNAKLDKTLAETDQGTVINWKDEEVNHLKKLVDRNKELEAREAELGRMESELQIQREELERRLKSLNETRQQISTTLQEKVVEDEKKIETLMQFYSNMKPSQAAKILEAIDEDLAVQIIGRMKKKSAADIMNLMKPEKAQIFTEKFAGYRKSSTP